MAVESAIQLMLIFGILIAAIMSSDKKSKTVLAAKRRRSYFQAEADSFTGAILLSIG
ncbi:MULTISPECIES: putative holin-like toxin [Bacillus]|uniref:putative holin-like toxin n=1 Tax=Bacillus TaxID=1386 RepID=UPI0004184443|nr:MULTISPECIES: putative holin-like toxin [Bacillus]QHZ44997.1 hypothetical protein M654_001150 [Bacillus sp. NSP9.1]